MNALTQRMAGRIHRSRRGRPCEYVGHTYKRAAVVRDPGGPALCPLCFQEITAEPLMDGRVRIPSHDRLSSVTVRVASR